MTPNNNRRKEERRPANGAVRLVLSEPFPMTIVGELMDVSKSGFRVSHQNSTLGTGVEVRYSHLQDKGRARAMWTRITGDRVETGFLILP